MEFERKFRKRDEGFLAGPVGEDIPLDESAFSPEQRMVLERKGYVVYRLTGQTVALLRRRGYQFWSTWHEGEPLETVISLCTEVAVKPDKPFLFGSNGKTLDEQFVMVKTFSKKINYEIPGTATILGTVADYTEVAFLYFRAKGRQLFFREGYNYIRTTTPTGGSSFAIVGHFESNCGSYISYLPRADKSSAVWAAPLVVPISAVER